MYPQQELPQHLTYRADVSLVRHFTQFETAVQQVKQALAGAPPTTRAPEAIGTFVLPLIEALGASIPLLQADLANYSQFVLQQAGGNDEPQVIVGLDPDDADALLDACEKVNQLLSGTKDAKKLADVKPRVVEALAMLADIEAGISEATLDVDDADDERLDAPAPPEELDDSPLEIG